MKKALMISVLTAASFIGLAGQAQAIEILPLKAQTVLSCRDARDLADAGISVEIKTAPLLQRFVAFVSEQSIAGPRELGKALVNQVKNQDDSMTESVFKGEKFSLVIKHELESEQGIPAVLTAELRGEKLEHDLLCQVVYHIAK